MAVLLSFTVWNCSAPGPKKNPVPGRTRAHLRSLAPGGWRLAATLVPDDNPDDGMIDLPAFPNSITFHADSSYKNGHYSAELDRFMATDTAKLEQLTESESILGTWGVRGDEFTLDDGELAHTYKFGVGNGMLTLKAEIAGSLVDLHYDQAV